MNDNISNLNKCVNLSTNDFVLHVWVVSIFLNCLCAWFAVFSFVHVFESLFAEELLDEKMKYKSLREEMEVCFQELQGMWMEGTTTRVI